MNEGTNIRKARRYLESNGYTNKELRQQILNAIRNDIPNSRLSNCKFLLGVTRLYLTNQLNNGNNIFKLNQVLKYITSDAHVNEYDNNLNDESFDTLVSRFQTNVTDDLSQSIEKSNSRQLTINNDYKIVNIDNFKTASKYSKYTTWCVTHDKNMYDSYTNNGLGRFYFCLKNNYQNEPKTKGNDCPLDSYGLSMIAVSINMDGSLNTVTCRWNHDNDGNDNIMTIDQLEDVIGRNFYKTFIPYTREELHAKGVILFDEVQDLLDSGKNPKEIFDYCGDFYDGFAAIMLNKKFNYINTDGKLISDIWFNWAYDFYQGFGVVELNNKYNYINKEGKYLSDQWLDWYGIFYDGFASIKLNGKWNYINAEGKYLSEQWFDWCGDDFSGGFASVELNNKYNKIDTNGKIISDIWFDYCGLFVEGFARVSLNNKHNFIDKEGKLLSDQWFDYSSDFCNGFARIGLNGKYNFIDKECKYVSDQWFGACCNFYNGFARVVLNHKWNLINTEGKIISDQWFDYCCIFVDGFAKVRLNDKCNYINKEGKLKLDQWFNWCDNFSEDSFKLDNTEDKLT